MNLSLDGAVFRVAATADNGVVSSDTRLVLTRRGSRILGRYTGGSIRRGCLVGTQEGFTLTFRYAQTEQDGHVHGGHSGCDLVRLEDGRLRIVEHFQWDTRTGSGINWFDEDISSP